MSFTGHDRVPPGEVSRNVDLLPACNQKPVLMLVRSSEFRALTTLEDQIEFFRKWTKLPLDMIGVLVDKSKPTLSRCLAAKTRSEGPSQEAPRAVKRHGPNSALTVEQEEAVIRWILERQEQQNCATPREVREYGSKLKSEADGTSPVEGQCLSRDWWHKFKMRHQETIGVKMATSREHARTRCTEAVVRGYFNEMSSVLSKIKNLRQIINMDETGFHSRIDRDRRRKCVYNKKCDTHVTFCQETASTTLSMMVTIAGDGQVLRPMFICKEDIRFHSDELRSIKNFVSISKSPKGYATEKNMLEWIDTILVPYITRVTEMLPDSNDKVYLVMDNCGIHNSSEVRKRWAEIQRLEIVWLPPHSSHFLQMLDGSMFGSLKCLFRNLRTPKTTPKIEGKIVRAYRAFWTAAFPTNVMASFQVTGFTYTYMNGAPQGMILDQKAVSDLILCNCLRSDGTRDGLVGDSNLE